MCLYRKSTAECLDSAAAVQDNPTCTNILVADVQNPNFDGVLTYEFLDIAPGTVKDPNDQRDGEWTLQTNDYVKYYATGTRNPYDVRVGRKGNVMVTINGPNFKFGAELTGVDADFMPQTGPDPETEDAVWLDLQEVQPPPCVSVYMP